MGFFTAILRRSRQHLDITSLRRHARETDVVEWSKNDPVVISPARASNPTDVRDSSKCSAGDRNLHEPVTHEKSEPSTVGREKGHRRALGAFHELRIHLVQAA